MKLSTLSHTASFLLETKTNSFSIQSTEKGDFSVLLSSQEKDDENTIHWPGEYEFAGVAVFLNDVSADKYLAKIFAEDVRFVVVNDKGLTLSDGLLKTIGNADVLVFDTVAEGGFSDSDTKKFIEEVDPRILILPKNAESKIQKLGFPFEEKSSLSVTRSSLPAEKTEYIVM